MKLLGKKIALNQPGTVNIIPEEPDDLWLAYNLISTGDIISTDTTRKIHQKSDSGDGKKSDNKNPSRVKLKLEIKITAVDYDKDSSALRVRGRNLVSNEHINTGTFHTLELEKNKEFELKKKVWDARAIDALTEGCDRSGGADLAVVLMHDGLAHMYLVGKSVTTLCAKIEGFSGHKSGSNKFFESVFRAFIKHVDFNTVRCVVIGSPGSIKDEFRRYLFSESQKLKLKSIEANKSRIVLANTSSGNKKSLKEVMNDTTVMNLIKGTKAAIDIRAMKEFTDMLSSNNSDRACYGPKSVEAAHELMAIETLMITDDLFRSAEIATRQKYIKLVQSVKNAGGKALVFSSVNVSGEQLSQLTGIAAILRFPLPDLDDMEL
uniref:Protein pelota homolog n=1 Tax=Davidia involucrata TaxID=16924 RepID=A0A5B7BUL4_DAVIN